MKKILAEFIRRGFIACGFGPLVLAVLYLVLQQQGTIETLTVNQVCLGIFSLSALAFIAGGLNVLYQLDRLPLAMAILIHGGVLYLSYLCTFRINNWLAPGPTPFIIFSLIFVFGYLAVWTIIYFISRKNTEKLNKMLKEKQQSIPH